MNVVMNLIRNYNTNCKSFYEYVSMRVYWDSKRCYLVVNKIVLWFNNNLVWIGDDVITMLLRLYYVICDIKRNGTDAYNKLNNITYNYDYHYLFHLTL